jgi:hypothetical protein
MRARGLFEQLDDFLGISAVVHADRKIDATQTIAEGPIGDLVGNKLWIGNNDICSGARVYHARSNADAAHEMARKIT